MDGTWTLLSKKIGVNSTRNLVHGPNLIWRLILFSTANMVIFPTAMLVETGGYQPRFLDIAPSLPWTESRFLEGKTSHNDLSLLGNQRYLYLSKTKTGCFFLRTSKVLPACHISPSSWHFRRWCSLFFAKDTRYVSILFSGGGPTSTNQ